MRWTTLRITGQYWTLHSARIGRYCVCQYRTSRRTIPYLESQPDLQPYHSWRVDNAQRWADMGGGGAEVAGVLQ
eukprot:2469210-Rhodomonas_salina.1